MKKLLVLALVAHVAMAEDSFVSGAKDIGKQLAEVPGEVKDISVEMATNAKDVVVDVSNKTATAVKGVAQTIKDSEIGQNIADVAGQFAGFPVQFYEDTRDVIKDGFNATVDATKTVGRKITNSRFAAKVKDANQVVVDTAKKTATKVKGFANDVVKNIGESEFVEDAKDVLEQFASAPREALNIIVAFFKASEEKVA
jgi:hypothetical protein